MCWLLSSNSIRVILIDCPNVYIQNFRNGVLTVRSLDFGLLFDWLFTDRQTVWALISKWVNDF
ncbi:hypothetical protein T07_290 [Trichinella nelsoni]|uniref:Uncharacterized protein n=1 Tax=Trichinella nelsoni TaxID=6336 RepID=A0A0V0S6X9_9BILA|nr:hypothetical protein T07_290 [Trichinella nelsoni]